MFFEIFKNPEIEKQIDEYKIIRLKSRIQFKTKIGKTKTHSAIVDTGAHTSVIPFSVWQDLVYEKIGECKMLGIMKKEECSIPVNVARVKGCLTDEQGSITEQVNIIAFLAKTDNIPLILGFNGLLDKLKISFDFNNNIAYAEY